MATVDSATWPIARWARLLDRMEHRQAGVGLRFWSPPLWLEVTMTGPDSDRWPLTDGPDRQWNWQSNEACLEAEELAAADAPDDRLLAVVSRYTVENLILNAVHEIGEWLRLDGRRPFPAHLGHARADGDPVVEDPVVEDIDGNGRVHVQFGYPPFPAPGGSVAPGPSDAASSSVDRVGSILAASRFSYLPGTSISYGPTGPVVTGPAGAATAWHAAWSPEVGAGVEAALAANAVDRFMNAIAADVHRALVQYEADRVCRAFHVDGHRVWTIESDRPSSRDKEGFVDPELRPLRITITYAAAGVASLRASPSV